MRWMSRAFWAISLVDARRRRVWSTRTSSSWSSDSSEYVRDGAIEGALGSAGMQSEVEDTMSWTGVALGIAGV